MEARSISKRTCVKPLRTPWFHGNCENPSKRVYVECRCYIDGEISITVRDEGPGFDSNAVPNPTTSEGRLSNHGRGIYLMKTLMDEVFFEESGTVVHLQMKPNAVRCAEETFNEIEASSLETET